MCVWGGGGGSKFSSQKVCPQKISLSINCLGMRSTCFLVVLQHVSSTVFSSCSMKTATKSGEPIAFPGPDSCCLCHQQGYADLQKFSVIQYERTVVVTKEAV